MNATTTSRSNHVFEVVYSEGTFAVERTVQAMAVILFGGFGIFSNISIIVLAFKYTVRKNLHHLIVNMSVADILIILTVSSMTLPEILRVNRMKYFPHLLAIVYCKSILYLKEVCVAASLLTLLIISIERFRATRMTVQRTRPYTLKQRLLTLALIWLLSLGIPSYIAVFVTSTNVYREFVTCHYDQSAASASFIVHDLLILSFLTLTIILTFLTLRRLSQPRAIEVNIPELQRKARKMRIKRVLKMVLFLSLSYAICYFPSYVFKMWTDKNWSKLVSGQYSKTVIISWWNLLFVFYYFLPIVNSCISPLIYVILLADFREAAKRVLYGRQARGERVKRVGCVQDTQKTSM